MEIKEIFDNIEYCNAIMSIREENVYKQKFLDIVYSKVGYKLGSIENVSIYLSPKDLVNNEQIIAMACYNGEIIVDDIFLKMSYLGQLWNIYHELGHVKLNHKERYPDNEEYKRLRKEYSKQNKILDIELEADEYCYERMNNHTLFMLGLKETKKMAKRYNRDIHEINLRIKYFKNKGVSKLWN